MARRQRLFLLGVQRSQLERIMDPRQFVGRQASKDWPSLEEPVKEEAGGMGRR